MKFTKKIVCAGLAVALSGMFATAPAYADEVIKCRLGSTCNIPAGSFFRPTPPVLYPVTQKDGTRFACYVNAKKKGERIVGKIFGDPDGGFQSAKVEFRARNNPIKFILYNGKFVDKRTDGAILVFNDSSAKGIVTCSRDG